MRRNGRKRYEIGMKTIATTAKEDVWLEGIIGAALRSGWLIHHCEADPTLSGGWATPIGDSTPGFPDIVAIHPESGETFVAELKSEHGRLSEGQAEWLDAFTACGIPARVLRPDDFDSTVEWLVGDRLISMGGRS